MRHARPLKWDELEGLLRRHHPRLFGSFRRGRRAWNRKPDAHDDANGHIGSDGPSPIAEGDGDADADGGWQVATGKRRGPKARRQQRFSDLVAEDWLVGGPELDWRRGRVVLEAERQQQKPMAEPQGERWGRWEPVQVSAVTVQPRLEDERIRPIKTVRQWGRCEGHSEGAMESWAAS
jgi:hypothetical protein